MSVTVGSPAPQFVADAVDGRNGDLCTVDMSEYLGQVVVLAFYPADGSPVCTQQLDSYSNQLLALGDRQFDMVAVSPQSLESHRAFAEERGGFAFPLVADEDHAIAALYGGTGMLGLYRRSVVVIDADGIVRSLHRALGPGVTYRGFERILNDVEALR